MRTCPIQISVVSLCVFVFSGCGDAVGIPLSQVDASLTLNDAPSAVDACICSATPVANRIGFDPFSTIFYSTGGTGTSTGCVSKEDGQIAADGELLGGGCVLENGPHAHRARLTRVGPYWDDIFPPNGAPPRLYIGWGGFWKATAHDKNHRIISTASCLLPADENVACQRDLWVSYEVKTSSIATKSLHDLSVSCPDGVLVGGGCPVKSPYDPDIRVLRAGFAPDNRDAWRCSWVNKDDTVQNEVMSIAFCLHEEPLPAECGCCPSLADSIVVKQENVPLHAGENRLKVRCDEGQFLMLGNCTIDVEDLATISDVTMFRSGFPPSPKHPDGDPSVWGCSWYNPTDLTPRAIATALCLPAPELPVWTQ